MDSVVGTEIGTVHNQRQGTGLATVLQGDRALDTYERLWAVDQAAQARRDQERAAKRNAAMTAIKSYQPEFFHRHNAEMTDALNKHFENGAKLLARIDDPFTSTDPEAVAWQKERAKVQAMANTSMQVKDQYTALQKQLSTSNPEDFDARSLSNAVSYVDNPLSKIIDEGLTMPVLMKKRPYLDSMKFIGERMSAWQSATGAAPTDNEIREFNKGLLNDPANKQQLVESYGSRLAQMTPEEKKSLQERADMAGLPETEQLMFEDSRRFLKRREPLNYQKELNAAADLAKKGISYNEGANPDASWSNPVKGSKMAAIKAAATAMFNSRDDYMTMFDKNGEVPRGAEMSDQEYAEEVKKYLASQLDPLVGVKTEYKKTEKGAGDAESVKGRNAFIEDMRSGDWRRAQGAANVLVGTRFANNLDVQDATITQGPNGFILNLDLGTNVTTKDVRDQIMDTNTGLSSEQVNVEQRQGRQVITIDLSEGAIENQTLARLIDNTTKATGKPYDPTLTERSPKTAIDAARTIVPGAPARINAPTTDISFWK